jgi:hypothetical protein
LGNQTYTNKTYIAGSSVTDTPIALTIQPSTQPQTLNAVFPCHQIGTNSSLTYRYRDVTIEDIQ